MAEHLAPETLAAPVQATNGVHSGPSSAAPGQSEIDRVKGTFLASLNHEIRTPLSGILGMADLLLETKLDDEQKEYVQAARLCAENLFEILNATLEYSALEGGQFTLDESEFSLKEMLEATVETQVNKARTKGLRLFSTIDAGLPETVVGDSARVRQVLSHLLSNAIKFTHHGSVELRVALEKTTSVNWLRASVRDTGIGIPPDRLNVIFESFHQIETGLARSYAGLGLGLALARKLVLLMGGEILVESTVGVGSTFTVRLPIRKPADISLENPAQNNGPRASILAVEDNPVGLMVLRHSLERHAVEFHGASDGRTAIEKASKKRFDLILMDLQMPEMDGFETTSLIRKLPGYSTVPVLALTANFSDEMRERCRHYGMQDFLSKPVESNRLWAAINRSLNRDRGASA